MSTVNEIRQTFLEYFRKNGHSVQPSSPLVPRNDPTLMFANSGMVQFKDLFLGREERPYKTATTAQKCVRAGGKHNDLDNVGYTARHHTFFEMMGNFSFGDYFKDRAIELAWNLVTGDFGLNKEKLLVTVYSEDEEAATLWKKIAGLPDSRIIRIPTSANFWMMGDTGPCGPCTEIFYDHGDKVWGGPPGSADEDGDRFIEIWNLVFMQYEQQADGTRTKLPKPSVDTGMGLERLTAVLQGKHNNYDIDTFQGIIASIQDVTGAKQTEATLPSLRVIADHLRSTAFLIADGVLPSNEGRGYVLRRIMRRAMRHAHLLGAKDAVIYKTLPSLVREMGQAYPELIRAEALISETIRLEEGRFAKTLAKGLQILEEETAKLEDGGVLSGGVAFKLYDTYGFPLDLTQDILRGQERSVDVDGFAAAMNAQKAEARKSWSGSGETGEETIWFEVQESVGSTEFLGYDTEIAEGQIAALVLGGKSVQKIDVAAALSSGQSFGLVLNQTPFYGESGGQVGDHGQIILENGLTLQVSDTQVKVGKLYVHTCTIAPNADTALPLNVGQAVRLVVDGMRRADVRAHHSATHLLHAALQKTLGNHVTQKGSLVSDVQLRFDISHPKALSSEEWQVVEAMVNTQIRLNAPVQTRLMPVDMAMEAGAMALFGEKYGEEVRVLSMGCTDDSTGKIYSLELCGGTHVSRTGDIGVFKLVKDSALGAGVRRIEAVAGRAAYGLFAKLADSSQKLAELFQTGQDSVLDSAKTAFDDRRALQKEVADLRRKLAAAGGSSGGTRQSEGSAFEDINGVRFTSLVVEGLPAKDLKPLVDDLKAQMGSGVVVAIATESGKASIVVGVTSDLTGRFSAVDLVKIGAEALGGAGGGGRPDMAQAGGVNPSAANDAIASIKKAVG